MSDTVEMEPLEIVRKVWAIITFGPATPTDGYNAGKFFQVVLDPNMVSPEGTFLRFDMQFQGGEVHGWQRVDAITVCEILSDAPEYIKGKPEGYHEEPGAKLILRKARYG